MLMQEILFNRTSRCPVAVELLCKVLNPQINERQTVLLQLALL